MFTTLKIAPIISYTYEIMKLHLVTLNDGDKLY